MPEQSLLNEYFLHKALYSLLRLRNTRQHFSITFEGHLREQNHQEKAQKCKKCGTRLTVKRYLFKLWKLKQEGRALPC